MKNLFFLLIFVSFTYSEGINIENFEANLYSKTGNNTIKKISLTTELEGRDLMENKGKILDSINMIISSYFVEDIMTSKGKENFKKMVIEYAQKRYNVDLEAMYIIELKTLSEPSIDEIISAIRSTDICKNTDKKHSKNQNFMSEILQNNPNKNKFYNGGNSTQSPNLNEYDITKDPNFGKDFGEN